MLLGGATAAEMTSTGAATASEASAERARVLPNIVLERLPRSVMEEGKERREVEKLFSRAQGLRQGCRQRTGRGRVPLLWADELLRSMRTARTGAY